MVTGSGCPVIFLYFKVYILESCLSVFRDHFLPVGTDVVLAIYLRLTMCKAFYSLVFNKFYNGFRMIGGNFKKQTDH